MFKKATSHWNKTFALPQVFWGAEMLEEEVRIVGLKQIGPDKFSVDQEFQGSYEEANRFGEQHFLKFKGLPTAVSHLPYKLCVLEDVEMDRDDDVLESEEKLRPVGLKSDDISSRLFHSKNDPLFLQMRESHLEHFMQGLPSEVSTIPFLSLSTMAYHHLFGKQMGPGNTGGLIVEEDFTHLLIYQDMQLQLSLKCFMGWSHAEESAELYVKEIQKVLTYFLQSKLLRPPIEQLYLFKDGPAQQVQKLESIFGLPLKTPILKSNDVNPSNPVKPHLLGALGMAQLAKLAKENGALENMELTASISEKNVDLSESRKKWMDWSRRLLKFCVIGLGAMTVSLLLMLLIGYSFDLYLKDEKVQSAAAREKLATVQSQRAVMKSQIRRVQGALVHRTRLSETFQQIATALPEKLWLHHWETTQMDAGKGHNHVLTGYCYSEKQVGDFMGALEKQGLFKSVKLKSTESIPGTIIQKKTGLSANRQDLIQFTLQVSQ